MKEKYAKYPHWGGLEKEAGDSTTIEQAIATGGRGWEVVAYEKIEDEDVAAVEITGLDLNADEAYMLEVFIVNPDPETAYYYVIRFNEDDVSDNYQTRYLAVNTSNVVSAGVLDDALIMVGWKTGACEYTIVRCGEGYPMAIARAAAYVTDDDEIVFLMGNVVWKVEENVTSITIREYDGEAMIGAGSRIILYKLKKGS